MSLAAGAGGGDFLIWPKWVCVAEQGMVCCFWYTNSLLGILNRGVLIF